MTRKTITATKSLPFHIECELSVVTLIVSLQIIEAVLV